MGSYLQHCLNTTAVPNRFATAGCISFIFVDTSANSFEIFLVFYSFCQWRTQNEAEETMAPPEANLLRLLLVFSMNFQLLGNKGNKKSHSRRHERLTMSLTGPSRTKFLAALLASVSTRLFGWLTAKYSHTVG